MDMAAAAILGLVQGFTEWLPISSSGHLVVAQSLMKLSVPAEFDVVLMLGTIAALLLYFRQKIFSLASGLLQSDPASFKYVLLIALAGIPTAIVGFAAKDFFKGLFSQPFIVSILIFATGIFLFIASRKRNQENELSPKSALAVGFAQGLAVAPGISRSGSTIGAALLLGVKPKEAAEFSFLIGAPAMLIASLIELRGLEQLNFDMQLAAIGVITSFLAGYAGIGFFMEILKRGKLEWFAYYCVLAGMLFAALTFSS